MKQRVLPFNRDSRQKMYEEMAGEPQDPVVVPVDEGKLKQGLREMFSDEEFEKLLEELDAVELEGEKPE